LTVHSSCEDRKSSIAASAISQGRSSGRSTLGRQRERLYRLLLEPADTSDQELAALQHTFAGALSRASLEPTLPLRWRPRVDRPDDLPWLIALAAIELLRSPDVLRVRQCAGDGCGWLFLDHSRNQSRRWCSSSDCGNRHRVKNHDARPRRTGSSRS
jgi:predicted RNA-binding Zn ribbon-like protein